MINDNILSDRLNAFKKGEPVENLKKTTEEYNTLLSKTIEKEKLLKDISYTLIDIFLTLITSISYGFSIKLFFSFNWNFIEIFAVGFSIFTLTTKLISIFKKS